MISTEKKRNLLFGLSGSVASIKIIDLLELLVHHFTVKVILTKNAKYFIEQFEENDKVRLDRITSENGIRVYEDSDEWNWKKRGDEVLHIELRKWADLMLIAPLSANTMAKITNGICDNLLVSL